MPTPDQDFLDAYNDELHQLGCAASVATPTGVWHAGSIMIVAEDGLELGVLPDTIEPSEMAAIVTLLQRTFVRGVALGRQEHTREVR